ncbi:helix-turn-helix transcriptional regulator [Limnoglobus roseus]|uniref:DNA-binding response regulator n=1 Tax=Limnoglobus roseus TaxID=2598579 RepID=A0A5C1ANU2_9BACT|nr:response regulator transcription factor [Limnoglobus roseus]QEL19817.1 DNA-binding response regulator [Limnoglobus roseus]
MIPIPAPALRVLVVDSDREAADRTAEVFRAFGLVVETADVPHALRTAYQALSAGEATARFDYLIVRIGAVPKLAAAVPVVVAGAQESLPSDLSDREVEVLQLIAMGYSNKEIGTNLKLSVKTIETFKSRAYKKLGLRSRVALVRYAALRGWFNGL